MLRRVRSWIHGYGCPFYRIVCQRRKQKCVGYFEGFTDAQAMAAAKILADGLKDVVVTEEGAKAFEAMHAWNPEDD